MYVPRCWKQSNFSAIFPELPMRSLYIFSHHSCSVNNDFTKIMVYCSYFLLYAVPCWHPADIFAENYINHDENTGDAKYLVDAKRNHAGTGTGGTFRANCWGQCSD